MRLSTIYVMIEITEQERALLEAAKLSPERNDLPRRVSGRWVVFVMVAFAATMVGLMWLYWEAYTRPYRDLQTAIAAAYPGSSPRVIGGRHKSGKHGEPLTLRVLVYISLDDFNPEEPSEKREVVLRNLAALAAEHQDLGEYEILEIRLMQRLPEQKWRRFDSARPVAQWRDVLAADGVDTSHWPSTTANSAKEPGGLENSSKIDSAE